MVQNFVPPNPALKRIYYFSAAEKYEYDNVVDCRGIADGYHQIQMPDGRRVLVRPGWSVCEITPVPTGPTPVV